MQDFVFFVGRFHVLVLHLPIGIIIAAIGLDWVARRPRYAALAQASPFLWGAAAISAVFTAALGYMHFAEGGFTGPSAEAHRLWGTVTAVASLAAWWLAARGRSTAAGAARLAAGIVMLALVSITGHYGGNLTHGTTFLEEYAPKFLRSLLGAQARRPAPASVAAADPYFDVVQPLLERRCGTCHNDDKRNGGFSVASYDSTLAGGDTGRAVVPGNLEASELFYRITLPEDDESHMPAEGKTPPTPAQIEILRWWIGAGAPRDTTVGGVGIAPDVEALLAAELGLGGAAPTAATASADPQLIANLAAAGLLARQVSQTDARLVVSVASPGMRLEAPALAALESAAAQIVDLNLAGTALDDAGMKAIGALPSVTHLRLARNRLTDAALADLAALPSLEHLNLYRNAGVTDSGLAALAASPKLRELFVWQTAVSPAGVARLREQRPGLAVDIGATPAP